MKHLFLMAFVCTFALASCTNTDTSQPTQNLEQTQPADSTAQAADTTAQPAAAEQPASDSKVTKTDQHGGGSHGTKGNATTPKGDAATPKGNATAPKGEVSKPEGNNSDRGESVTTGTVKNTRDVVNPAMREDHVKDQKDRNVKVVKP